MSEGKERVKEKGIREKEISSVGFMMKREFEKIRKDRAMENMIVT